MFSLFRRSSGGPGRVQVEPLEGRQMFAMGDNVVAPAPYYIPDLIDPNQQILVVEGTFGNDKIEVKSKSKGKKIQVKIGKKKYKNLPAVLRVLVNGGAGDDKIRIKGKVKGAIVFGSGGQDDIKGGDGDDILLGNWQDDKIDGGKGRDIVIGGDGADNVKGGKGEDLVTGGSTKWDYDFELLPLLMIQVEWTRKDVPYETRATNIMNGTGWNGEYKLDASTVFSGATPPDKNDGGDGRDLFFISADTAEDGSRDTIKKKKKNEWAVAVTYG
jgi:Ca2+-binding RTX toxin-like protein